MGKTIAIFVSLWLVSSHASAQTDSVGIYLTANDYALKKLSYKASCLTPSNKKLGRSYVSALRKQEQYHLEKSFWFGYHDCHSGDHRFYKKSNYRILHFSEDLCLYSKEILQPKGKFVETETRYYFSRKVDGVILPLEIKVLKKAFPENEKFHDLLDEVFGSDYSLIHFDKVKRRYQLIEVYEYSKNNP